MAVPTRLLLAALCLVSGTLAAQRTQKPALHGRHWMAITGEPLAATAGAMMFQRGGNPVDAACAMLAATTTMWDVLSWGGETQALIYNPRTIERNKRWLKQWRYSRAVMLPHAGSGKKAGSSPSRTSPPGA